MSHFSPWVVEWSDEQQCFHIDTLDDALKNNRIAFLLNQPLQYTILGMVRTVDEAHVLSKQLEEARSDETNERFKRIAEQ